VCRSLGGKAGRLMRDSTANATVLPGITRHILLDPQGDWVGCLTGS
jgi:hypothetical protein